MLALHATTVAVAGRAVVLTGPSGSGKSSLALQMMALGAQLVADDVTEIRPDGPALRAGAPLHMRGLIEARGFGLLAAPSLAFAPVALALDMGREEADRLPARRAVSWLGRDVPLLHRPSGPHLAAGMIHYLRWGRVA